MTSRSADGGLFVSSLSANLFVLGDLVLSDLDQSFETKLQLLTDPVGIMAVFPLGVRLGHWVS